MKKKVTKRIKNPNSYISTGTNDQQNENKTIDVIKSWGYGIFWAVVVLSIFSGFKYPWKWIDALYETENERREIIANEWNNAYRPLITWCANNSQIKTNSKFNYKNKINIKDIKNYIISSTGKDKNCLENKDFRIELINFPIKEVKENEIIDKWFSQIKPHIKNFNLSLEENTSYQTKQFKIETNLFYWSDIFQIDEQDFDMSDRSQFICAYPIETNNLDDQCNYLRNYYSEDEENDQRMKVFSINFLDQIDFMILSKGCFNGCIAEITYFYDMKKYNIRGLSILEPILKTWPKYSDKESSIVKEYDSMINKTYFVVNELEKDYLKPEWFKTIEIK